MRRLSPASLVLTLDISVAHSVLSANRPGENSPSLSASTCTRAAYDKIVIERIPCAVHKKLKQWLTGIGEQRLRSRNAKGTLYFAGGGGSGGPALRTASLFLTLPLTAEVIDCANLSIVA